MRRLALAAVALIALGAALLAYTVYLGQATGYVFVIIPIFQSSSPWAFGGMLSLLAGILLLLLSFAGPVASEAIPSKPATTGSPVTPGQAMPAVGRKFGGVVFLGPIPIVFGSDKRVAKWMLILATVLVILLIIAFLFLALR